MGLHGFGSYDDQGRGWGPYKSLQPWGISDGLLPVELGRMEPSIWCCDPVGMVMSQGETALGSRRNSRIYFKCWEGSRQFFQAYWFLDNKIEV